jgi:hypothetical protein
MLHEKIADRFLDHFLKLAASASAWAIRWIRRPKWGR